MVCGVGLLLVGFLPLIGPLVGAVLGVLISGRLLANELLTRPLEERGMDREARRAFLRAHLGGALGFGVAAELFVMIPLGAIAVMPAAVVGSTTLARDRLADPARTLAQPVTRRKVVTGQRPLSVYAGPASSEVAASAASTRRAVKSAHRPRAWVEACRLGVPDLAGLRARSCR